MLFVQRLMAQTFCLGFLYPKTLSWLPCVYLSLCMLGLLLRPSGWGPVGQGFPSPLPTLPPVRYLAYSGQPITHSGVTVSPLGDETKRRVDTHSTATRVFELALHRSAGACAKL